MPDKASSNSTDGIEQVNNTLGLTGVGDWRTQGELKMDHGSKEKVLLTTPAFTAHFAKATDTVSTDVIDPGQPLLILSTWSGIRRFIHTKDFYSKCRAVLTRKAIFVTVPGSSSPQTRCTDAGPCLEYTSQSPATFSLVSNIK